MNPSFQLRQSTPLFCVILLFACIGLLPTVQAVNPPPDGGYPNFNTAEGDKALFNLTTGSSNTALGFEALVINTGGNDNTAVGKSALRQTTSGSSNTAIGSDALHFNTTGDNNTAIGDGALHSSKTGFNNVAVGASALFFNTTGSTNIALGPGAGKDLTTGNRNIVIGNDGVKGEEATIRIGTDIEQTRVFIAGIAGKTTSDGVPVLVSTDGKLGTRTSSARFKDEIKPMDKASEVLFALTPVAFRYKKDVDPAGVPQFGLVAEDVAKVNPDLVVRDKEGKPFTVRYDAVNAMLLNEFLKEHGRVQELEATVAQQRKDSEATAERQQKQIEALTAGLRKVSAQLELNKPAPRTVLNNQ